MTYHRLRVNPGQAGALYRCIKCGGAWPFLSAALAVACQETKHF